MVLKVYKYALPITGCNEIQLPVGARIVSFDIPSNGFQLWAIVPVPVEKTEQRTFHVKRTGFDEIIPTWTFIQTCHIREFGEVWHLFEEHK